MDRQRLLIIIAVVVVIVIAVLVFGLKNREKENSVTIEFWSVYDDITIYEELINAYHELNKHVTIKYQKKPFVDYERELINALAAGEGPDILSIHHTWLPRYKDKIKPMPQIEGFITPRNFQDIFVDVAYYDFVDEDKIYAIPLYVDTLGLYYNRDLFNSAGISSPPTTWDEFLDDVELLTKKDQWSNIVKSGVAMGTAENINRSTDILSLLMLQTGAKMIDDIRTRAIFNQRVYSGGKSFNPGEDALRFYTDFSNPINRVYCWNRQMPYSIDAFYQGKVAMMINYSYHIDTIRAKSSYFDFGVAPAPQIKDRDFDINYANYWAHTVSKKSKHSEEAWKFLLFLSQRENLKKYLEKAKRPTSRRDLIEWQRKDPDLGIFANQSLSARSWYQVDTQAIEQIFAYMVKSVVLGESTIAQAINKAADQVTVLMRR